MKLIRKIYWMIMNFLLILNFKLREASCIIYRNVTMINGDVINGQQLVELMNQYNSVILKDENGTGIIMTHGFNDGSMKMDIPLTVNELGMRGMWFLISCYNGLRQDYHDHNVSIIREPLTRTDDAIAFTIIDGDLWLSVEPELVKLNKIASSIKF